MYTLAVKAFTMSLCFIYFEGPNKLKVSTKWINRNPKWLSCFLALCKDSKCLIAKFCYIHDGSNIIGPFVIILRLQLQDIWKSE